MAAALSANVSQWNPGSWSGSNWGSGWDSGGWGASSWYSSVEAAPSDVAVPVADQPAASTTVAAAPTLLTVLTTADATTVAIAPTVDATMDDAIASPADDALAPVAPVTPTSPNSYSEDYSYTEEPASPSTDQSKKARLSS